jgi:hypothetical protein
LKTRLPVRSALFKQRTGGLVVRWVTTSEYPLLYVFAFLLPLIDLLMCTWSQSYSVFGVLLELSISPIRSCNVCGKRV